MLLEMRPRILTYVGNDRGMLNVLARCLDPTTHRIEHYRPEDWSLHAVTPSWRCDRVVLIDHFEAEASHQILEDLSRHDAGVPVVVVVERSHDARLTVAGLARLHGADRLVLKPVRETAILTAAIDKAFRRLDHWRARLEQPCFLENGGPMNQAIDVARARMPLDDASRTSDRGVYREDLRPQLI